MPNTKLYCEYCEGFVIESVDVVGKIEGATIAYRCTRCNEKNWIMFSRIERDSSKRL